MGSESNSHPVEVRHNGKTIDVIVQDHAHPIPDSLFRFAGASIDRLEVLDFRTRGSDQYILLDVGGPSHNSQEQFLSCQPGYERYVVWLKLHDQMKFTAFRALLISSCLQSVRFFESSPSARLLAHQDKDGKQFPPRLQLQGGKLDLSIAWPWPDLLSTLRYDAAHPELGIIIQLPLPMIGAAPCNPAPCPTL